MSSNDEKRPDELPSPAGETGLIGGGEADRAETVKLDSAGMTAGGKAERVGEVPAESSGEEVKPE